MRKFLLALVAVLCFLGICINPGTVMAAEETKTITLTVYIVGEEQPFTLSISPNDYIGNIKLYLQDQTDVDLNKLDLMHDNGHTNRVLLETKNFYHYNIRDGQTITTRVSTNWNYDIVNGVENTTFTIARPIESNLNVVNANTTFGMSPDNESNYTAFQAAMDFCKANPGTMLVINPGKYYFKGMSSDIKLDNLENILIDGQGAEFIFETEHCIKLTACNGVELRNLIIDWDWDSSRIGSLVRIENVSPHHFDVHFLELEDVPEDIFFGSFLLYDENELVPGSYGEYRGYSPWQDSAAIRSKEKIAPNVFHIEHNGHMYMMEEGDVYLLRHYIYSSRVFGTTHYSRNITFNNIKIYSFTGMGWVFSDRTSHFQIINSYLGLRPGEEDNRRISMAADAIHVLNTAGYFRIDNNDLSFNGDDVINVHDDTLIINSIDDSRTELTGWVTAGFVNPGEKVKFRNSQMGEFTDYEATVTYISRDSETNIATLRFAEPLPDDILNGYYVYCSSFTSSNYVITNNYIHETKGRAVLLNADNALFANNYIYRTVSESINVQADITTGRWTGGIGSNNVYILNNTFEECNFGGRGPVIEVKISIDGVSPDENVFNNLHIEDNNFISCLHNETQNAIDIRNVDSSELTVTGNTLIDSGNIVTHGILQDSNVLGDNSVSSTEHTHNWTPVEESDKHVCTSCPAERFHSYIISGANVSTIERCDFCGITNPSYISPVTPEPAISPEVTPTTSPSISPVVTPTTNPTVTTSPAPTIVITPTISPSTTAGTSTGTSTGSLPDPTVIPSEVTTPVPTVTPTPTIDPALIQRQQVTDFVARMYTVALGRQYDQQGLEYWTDLLISHEYNGAGIAFGFIESEEFHNKGLSNEDYVDTLYATFFDREPDKAGRESWINLLQSGKSREFVLAGFVNSLEFDQLSDRFGIIAGYMFEDGSVANAGIYQFTERMYTKVLDRDAEKEGLNFWAMNIISGQFPAADVARLFFSSQEFLDRNLSNEEYVEVLYQTFMDRSSDPDGKAMWVELLNTNQKSREQVLEGFAGSLEFYNILVEYGLIIEA